MPAKVKVTDTWKTITSARVKVNGQWRIVTTAFVKVGSTWKKWLSGLVTDLFNRANTITGLGVSTSGHPWEGIKGNWFVSSNKATSTDSIPNLQTASIATIDMGVTDAHVTADVSDGTGIVVWLSDGNSWWGSYVQQVNGTGGGDAYSACDQGYVSNGSNPPAGNCCSGVGTSSSGGGYSCNAGLVPCSGSTSNTCSGTCCGGVMSNTSGGYTYAHEYDAGCSPYSCRYLGSANTASKTYQCNSYPYLILSGSRCINYNNSSDSISAVLACPSGYDTQGSLCAQCSSGQTGAASGCGSLYSCYGSGTTCTSCSTGTNYSGACYNYSATTSYSCYTSTTYTPPTTNYSCYTSSSQHTNPTYTTFTSSLVIVSSTSGNVVSQASSQISTNNTGFTTVGSIVVATSGESITAAAYADPGAAGTPIATATKTYPGAKGTKTGILKAYSSGSQGTTIDNFSVTA